MPGEGLAAGDIQDDLHRLGGIGGLVDGDAVGLHLGQEAVHVMVEMGDHLGAHRMGAQAHGLGIRQGGESRQPAFNAPFGVTVQGFV